MAAEATVYFSRLGWSADLLVAHERMTIRFDSQEETIDWSCGALRSRGGGRLTIKGRDGYVRARASVPPVLDAQWFSK